MRGSLRISTSIAFGRRVLRLPVLRHMSEHPDLQVDLGVDDRQVNLVEQGADVAIRTGRLTDSSRGVRCLGANPWVVLLAADAHRARRSRPASPTAIADHDALICSCVQGDERRHFGSADGAAHSSCRSRARCTATTCARWPRHERWLVGACLLLLQPAATYASRWGLLWPLHLSSLHPVRDTAVFWSALAAVLPHRGGC